MSANACPNCNKPLPASVVSGPAQAVVRCEGCQTLLLWSNGRVMRSARSSTGTMMGMPAVTTKAAASALRDNEAPLPELTPEADAVAPPPKPSAAKPPPPKAPAPRPATQPMLGRVPPPRATVTGLGDNSPTRVAPPSGELRKESARKDPTPAPAQKAAPAAPQKSAPSAPQKSAPSGPIKTAPSGAVKLPPPAAAAKPVTPSREPARPDAGKSETPHVVVAAVAPLQQAGGADMVDPSAWFAGGDVSDVVPPEKLPPIESTKPPRGETTGAQPLPPPPSLPSLPPLEVEPFEIEAPDRDATPASGTLMPEVRSGPIATNPREPSQKIAATAAKKPAPPRAATELPSAGTSIGKPPETNLRATVMGRPALEVPKPAEPVAAAFDLLPPASTTPPPSATPPMSSTPPPPSSSAMPGPNAPKATIEREVSAEALPPPPSPSVSPPAADDTTSESELPAQPPTMLPLPETTRVPREVSRRMLFTVGGAAAGVILLVLMALSLLRGPKPPASKPDVHPPAATTPPTTPPAPAPTAVAPTPTPAEPPPTATPTPPEPTEAAAPTPPRPRRTLGGKKVVLEYDPKPTSPAPPPPQAPTPMGEDPATVARAREAYHRGNVKLFAGDDDGAIALYRESLKIYPGYVAGYRGLGLAFEEAGRKSDALTAFHTYVRTVPNAVDAAIIRRRIEHLESAK
ncbi:MAG TPA: tetratricopeptide repeat protein [Polyangia bacterium]